MTTVYLSVSPCPDKAVVIPRCIGDTARRKLSLSLIQLFPGLAEDNLARVEVRLLQFKTDDQKRNLCVELSHECAQKKPPQRQRFVIPVKPLEAKQLQLDSRPVGDASGCSQPLQEPPVRCHVCSRGTIDATREVVVVYTANRNSPQAGCRRHEFLALF